MAGKEIPEEVSVKLCRQMALTLSVLPKTHPLAALLAVGLLSLPAERGMQSMGEMRSFDTTGCSESWISSEVRVSRAISDPLCSVFFY